MMRRILAFFILFVLCHLLSVSPISAADIKTDYQVQYIPTVLADGLGTKVNFNIKLTNLNPQVYVKKFSLNFPSSFHIRNLKASDDKGPITPILTEENDKTKLEVEFSNPNTKRDESNTFYLEFNQDKLFTVNGNVWEVILPTIVDEEESSTYKVIVNLPESTDKKLSIAKPKPSIITGKQIVWDNPQSRTIYAVFGDSQYYETDLTFTIKNPKLTPVYTEVAFPPQTSYQKIYVTSIDPKPAETYEDEDGNYLGKYYLNPSETKTIRYKGIIEIQTKPFEDMIPIMTQKIETQKKYLLSSKPYWELSESTLSQPELQNLKTPKNIYDYIVHKLIYNYGNVKENNTRLGAQNILERPDQAVCVEFADLFVGLAREKGIYARELEGFGFSQDEKLRPLSLLSDVLHSWPEYYEVESQQWKPLDPTWENTSGIDYFSSLDLNHIVFAIHGARPDYPVPAGMYKTDKSQDIFIKPTTKLPITKTKLFGSFEQVPSILHDKSTYKGKVLVTNNGNTFRYNIPIEIQSKALQISQNNVVISSLAPYETKIVNLDMKVINKKMSEDTITVLADGQKLAEKKIKIQSFYLFIGYIIGGLVLVAVFFIVAKKMKTKKEIYETTSP